MKTLVIGVDGASYSLLEKLFKENKTPFLKKLADKGCFFPLKSVIPPDSPCAWSVSYTSLNPSKTGIYGFDKKNGKSYCFRVPNAVDRHAKDVWQIVSEQNKKVLIASMPLSFPPRKVNGLMITDHFTPDASKAVYPKKRTKEIVFDYGYPLDSEKFVEVEEFVDSIKKRMQFIEKEIKKNDFDLVMLGIEQMEITCHKYLIEKPEKLLRLYEGFDFLLKEFVEKNFLGWTIFLHSDHGHKIYNKEFHVGSWLKQKNFLVLKNKKRLRELEKQKIEAEKKQLLKKHGFSLKGKTALFFYGLRAWIKKVFPGIKNVFPFLKTPAFVSVKEFEITESRINYNKSIAFPYQEGHGNYGAIYVNTQENWQNGIIKKNEYNSTIKKIVKELKKESFVKNVWLKTELFSGIFLKEMPDIFFELKPEIKVNGFDKNYQKKAVYKVRATQHEMNGFFIGFGENIKKTFIEKADLFDIAPTILYSLGLKIPIDYEGRVLEIFTKKFQEKNSLKKEKIVLEYNQKKTKISRKGQEKLENQLKGLGYI